MNRGDLSGQVNFFSIKEEIIHCFAVVNKEEETITCRGGCKCLYYACDQGNGRCRTESVVCRVWCAGMGDRDCSSRSTMWGVVDVVHEPACMS